MESRIERYLTTHYDEEINELLNSPDELLHVAIGVSLTHLARTERPLYNALTAYPKTELDKWNRSLWQAQKSLVEGPQLFLEPGFKLKHNCHVRFTNMPSSSSTTEREGGGPPKKEPYPKLDQVGRLVKVSGTVVRMTQAPKFVEYKREYVCKRCKHEFDVEAAYEQKYVFNVPWSCPMARETGCKGVPVPKNDQPVPDYCRNYQEIRLQEVGHSNVPASILVTLENDLVDSCQPGDRVNVIGTVELRCGPGIIGKQTELTITLRANSLTKEGNKMNTGKDLAEHLCFVRAEWQGTVDEIGELAARDLLVQSICPEIHGMYPVKLAIALSLASCAQRDLSNTTATRGHSHLLLVGDPGLAKSRLLRFAADVSSRSVFTTGMGCSAAGLTAAAVKEDGEWQLEAGALVIADGGICCIDEFNLMREADKASIHEAMEQQTISVAKAGIRCTLGARCAVLAATNPKIPFSVSELEGESASLGVGGPLLSRFDLVLVLRDQYDPEWFMDVCDHILSLSVVDDAKEHFQQISPDTCWSMDTLQRHFQAIQEIDPQFSEGAKTVLNAYYLACRANPMRSQHRTTPRLLESLRRLAQAHARLLFREVVTAVDAITVVRLMESTYEMGRILKPMDVIRAKLPLGPTPPQIQEVLGNLPLERPVEDVQVKQGDPAKLEQFRRKLAEKGRNRDSGNKWETLSSQRMAQFDQDVLAKLEESARCEEEAAPAPVPVSESAPELKSKSAVDDLYSKYSYTQYKKKAAKKVKKAEPERQPVPQDGIDSEEQLNALMGGLRENFASGVGERTQRPESFHTQLDISSFLLDDDDEEEKEVESAAPREEPRTEDDSVSRYKITLPRRKKPKPIPPPPPPQDELPAAFDDIASLLANDDEDDEMGAAIPSAVAANLPAPEPTPSTCPAGGTDDGMDEALALFANIDEILSASNKAD
uniref:DNA helicase MCM9 n=1 Tax=Culex tarsalis TaxID=7177 RepID=A0A1Q3FWA5_CULTA